MIGALTVAKEDYLKAIIEAESEGRDVAPGLLSHWLHVRPPAVTKAIRRLREDGLVREAQGAIRLTQEGRRLAHQTAFRHYLVERMLGEIFGMDWHQIHAEAERLEHAISPAFEAKLVEKLGETATCPHGNHVLPESPAKLRQRGLAALSEVEAGGWYRVVSLYERDARLLGFLHELGIGPGTELHVVCRNYDATLSLVREGHTLTLGLPAAEKIFVQDAKAVHPGKDAKQTA